MIKANPVLREDQPDDKWTTIEAGVDLGRKVNLSAIQDYAACNLPARAIAGILGLGERTLYQQKEMRMALYTGRGLVKLWVAQQAIRNSDSPAVLGKWMDALNTASADPDAGDRDAFEDSKNNSEVQVTITYPKKNNSVDEEQ